MKRIDKVEQALAKLSADHGVTASELADNLRLSRANVSSDLNELCKKGVACKTGSKPVFYKSSETVRKQKADDILTTFMQSNRSLFHCVEQAKAAVLYPPHGMHMMLLGETGVGKSMFAELIYQYAKESGFLSDHAPFIVFNCADYSDNPQLLLSQLMGTKKGAFTGAEEDRPGLLEKADGGVLFLDEVHRLPPQGQEMLFTFIDKGVYRRLGETEAERHASVLLLCATTENPKSNLLQTFVRRIPMLIHIPSLSERSVDERLNLIGEFFLNESARLKRPILVSVNSVRSFLGYHCPNNIGQLKNDIRIICAEAYSDYISGKKDDITIVSHSLPDYIREGLYSETSHREIWKRFIGTNRRFCVFDSKGRANLLQSDESDESIYDTIDSHMQELKKDGVDDSIIEQEISRDIHSYFEKYMQTPSRAPDFGNLRNLVGMDVISVTDKILSNAEETLIRNFNSNVRYGLAVHIYSAINRVQHGRRIVNPQLNQIRQTLPKEFSAALSALKIINETFRIDMPIDEAGFLTVFFDLDHHRLCEKVLVIVIAHGQTTATSMAETANRLLGINCAMGIDAFLDEKPQSVYLRLKELVKSKSPNSGVLLLVDMGSLTDFATTLQKELKIPARVIPLVSTLHVIEAARKASLGYSLDCIYQETKRVSEQPYDMSNPNSERNGLAKAFVVTVCSTGEGSATLMKNLLDSQLNYHHSFCETIAMKLTDIENIESRLSTINKIGKILCIVSTFHTNFSAPHYTLAEVLDGNAVLSIQKLIDKEAVFAQICDTFSTMLKSRESTRIFTQVHVTVSRIEQGIRMHLKSDVLIGVLCHMGCMVDRLLDGRSVGSFPGKTEYAAKNSVLFKAVKEFCSPLEKEFSISVPDDEICHIMTFFIQENCEGQGKTTEMISE